MSEFRIVSRNGGGDVVLSVLGEVDIATAWELERALNHALEGPATRLVLDLRGVRFMDASGAALLLRQELHARAVERQLLVVRGQPPVQRLFELTGLADKLTFIEEAPLTAA
jgi:anti-anti-sigma factor